MAHLDSTEGNGVAAQRRSQSAALALGTSVGFCFVAENPVNAEGPGEEGEQSERTICFPTFQMDDGKFRLHSPLIERDLANCSQDLKAPTTAVRTGVPKADLVETAVHKPEQVDECWSRDEKTHQEDRDIRHRLPGEESFCGDLAG
jgi:hypothetical protein